MQTYYPTSSAVQQEDYQRSRNIKRVSNDTPDGPEETKDKLDVLANKNSKVLFQIRSVFPFTIFPDDLVIDREKVSIVTREFFGSGRVHSFLIENISDLYVDTTMWLATIRFHDKYYAQNAVEIRYLKKSDAVRARRIIQGLIVAREQKVNLNALDEDELLPRLEEIGSAV